MKASDDRQIEPMDPAAGQPAATRFEKARSICLGLLILGGVGVLLGWPMNPNQFYFCYLTSWAFCWTTLMGVLFFVMLHHVVDAGWSTVVRRPAEQMLAAMPWLLVLAIPILIGMFTGHLHEWLRGDPHLEGFKGVFLSVPFLIGRLAIYAAAFLWLSFVLRRNSLRQDADGAAHWSISSRRWASGGMVIYALTMTFCAIDLMMALNDHWFSTIFSVYVWSGAVVAGLCAITLLTIPLMRGPLRNRIGSDQIYTLGALIFAFSVFWAYIAFSQYFLIWYSNIPEETIYFLRRWTGLENEPAGTWWILSILMPIGRFVLPFLILMSALTKRNPKILGIMCVILLFSHWLDQYWMVQPAHSEQNPPIAWLWMDLSCLMLIVGICGMAVIRALRGAALFPLKDPRLVEALSAEPVDHLAGADAE